MEFKLCRVCGKSTKDNVHIFRTEGLVNKLETCLPLIVSPHSLLPDCICIECHTNVNNFYIFIKTCLQNIIILENQLNIFESCLKTKRRHEKSTSTNDSCMQYHANTNDTFDVDLCKEKIIGFAKLITDVENNLDSHEKSNQKTKLVDYDLSGDDLSENELEKFTELRNEYNHDLIQEIFVRKSQKRKADTILNSHSKIFKLDKNRRKRRAPVKVQIQTKAVDENDWKLGENMFTHLEIMEMERNIDFDPKINENDWKMDEFAVENVHRNENFAGLPLICLLCDIQFGSPAILATHVFEIHGIDMAQIASSEPILEKKKKIPNLVKIADLKQKRDSNDSSPEDCPEEEEPPCLDPTFVCPLCPESYTNKSDLFVHLRITHPTKSHLICGLCLYIASTYLNLTDHLESCKNTHKIGNPFICKVCKYNEDNLKSIENHILVHDFIISFCKKEGKIYDPNDYVEINKDIVLIKNLNCSECGESFVQFKEFSTHRRSLHSIFHCDLCNKFYGRNSHLWKHVNRLHKGHPSITCQLCYKTSASKYHLAQHFNKIHTAKTPKHKNSDEEFLSKKFDGFDFQSVKQSFMRQELLKNAAMSESDAEENGANLCENTSDSFENDDEGTKPVNDASHNYTEDQTNIAEENAPILRISDRLDVPDDENAFKTTEKRFMTYENTNGIKSYENESTDPENYPNIPEDGVKVEAFEIPREIDATSLLYNNIITNYTPPENSGEFKCPKCLKSFHKKPFLKKHKKNCRPRLQKDLLTRCKSCSRIFKDRQSLAKHLVNYHSEYECEICKEKVQSKCEIVSHIRFTHPECHLFCFCGNILRNQEDLNEHQAEHTESFVCQFCADILPSKIKLKMHILSLHRKILSLSCGICLKLFETQHVLRDHVRLVHKSQLLVTSCTVCGKNYGSKWKTYDHLNKSHGRIFKPCRTCLDVFDNELDLQLHCDTYHHTNLTVKPVKKNGLKPEILKKESELGVACKQEEPTVFVCKQELKDPPIEREIGLEAISSSSDDSDQFFGSSKSGPPHDFMQLMSEKKVSLLEKRLLGVQSISTSPPGQLSVQDEIDKFVKMETSPPPNHSSDDGKQEEVELTHQIVDVPENLSPIKKNKPTLVKVSKKNRKKKLKRKSNDCATKRTVYVDSDLPSVCELCQKKWPAKKHLWQHYIRCHKPEAATICGICLKTNGDYEILQTHLNQSHPTLLHGQGFGSNFICRICGRYHNASSKLRLHMAIHEHFNWDLIKIKNNNENMVAENMVKIENTDNNDVDIDYKDVDDACPEKDIHFIDNQINYESLIEQVECSSDDLDFDSNPNDFEASASPPHRVDPNQSLDLDYYSSQNILQNDETCSSTSSDATDSSDAAHLDPNYELNANIKQEEFDDEMVKSEPENSRDSLGTPLLKVIQNMNIYARQPEVVDSAVKSICFDATGSDSSAISSEFCELEEENLNPNEIQSAVDSIL